MTLHTLSLDKDGFARIATDGPLTSRTLDGVTDNPLQTLLGNGWTRRKILLDLSHTDYLDSTALGWLLNCHRQLSQNGGRLLLHSAQPKVIQFLRLLKLEAILPLYENESAALSTLATVKQAA